MLTKINKIMKKNISLLIIILLSINLSAQEGVIVPLTTPHIDIQSGTYKKDLNSELNPYIGTWVGIWNNKKFTLKLEKYTKKTISYPDGDYFYKDLLVGKYKVTNLSSGEILQNNINNHDNEAAKITSAALPKNNRFKFTYMDDEQCFNVGNITLVGNPGTNQLVYWYEFDSWWDKENCQYASKSEIPIPIPTVSVTLTKL
jgi:hypothetical protein